VFPIAPRFYPNWFAQRLNSHVYKLKRGCQREAKFRLLCWECPKFQKYWWWANQMAPSSMAHSLTN
jgi:hypothetical protein